MILCLWMALMCLLAGCAPAAGAAVSDASSVPEITPEPQSVTFAMVESQSAAAPTLPPMPTPLPTREPLITDAWYLERCALIARLMVENSFAAGIDEANARVQERMELDPNKPMVALTFDDGPTPGVTSAILDTLEKYNARATFFVVGTRIAGSESTLKRAVSLGCEIGSHTWNHDTLTEISEDRARESLNKTNEAVFAACGYPIRSLRPPKGLSNDRVKALAGEMGMALVFWNHSTHDYRIDSAEKIASYVDFDKEDKKALEAGDIILLHDLRKPTRDAMEQVVSKLVGEGYQLVTVQELLNCSAGGFAPGKSYKRQG